MIGSTSGDTSEYAIPGLNSPTNIFDITSISFKRIDKTDAMAPRSLIPLLPHGGIGRIWSDLHHRCGARLLHRGDDCIYGILGDLFSLLKI